MKWISVEDRLPDERQRVIVWRPKKVNGVEQNNWWQTQSTIYVNGFHVDNAHEIAYWQPTPEPPKE